MRGGGLCGSTPVCVVGCCGACVLVRADVTQMD